MTAPNNWRFIRTLPPGEMLREIVLEGLPPKPTVFLIDLTVSAIVNHAAVCSVSAEQTGDRTVYTELVYTFDESSDSWDSDVTDSGRPDDVRERVLARKDVPNFERYALDNVVDEAVHHEAASVSLQSSKTVDPNRTTIRITSSWPKPRR